jgi:predicted small lipoprotein YifL
VLKRNLIILLVLALAFSLAGCGKATPPAPAPQQPAEQPKDDWKIGIMSSTVTQNEEEFRMAAEMQKKYGADRILHTTYPDRFMQEQETTITNMLEMASTPGVKAIIMVQAIPGAVAAVDKVRELFPEILFILGSPQEDPDIIAQKGDIVLNTDDLGRGYQIADHAKAMGAEVLVHYSFPRHMSIEMLAKRRALMKERAEQLGIRFVDEDAPDPTSDAGVPGTQQFIMEDVPRKIAQYGKNTAVFGTNCAMQEPLIRQAVEHGGIFPVQCCPSPYHALPAAMAISVPDDKKGNVPWMLEQIKAKCAQANATGRVATWPVPVNMMYIEAGVEYAIKWIKGETNGRNDKQTLIKIMEDIAKGPVTLTEYPGTSNYYLYLSDHFIF